MNVDKLIDFLQKEVPKNAIDLNNAINSTLGIIKGTRSALQNSISELLQLDKHNEIGNFLNGYGKLFKEHCRGFREKNKFYAC
jgi:hypothetical protein